MSTVDLGTLEYAFGLNLAGFEAAAERIGRQLQRLDQDTQRRLDNIGQRGERLGKQVDETSRRIADQSRSARMAVTQAQATLQANIRIQNTLTQHSRNLYENWQTAIKNVQVVQDRSLKSIESDVRQFGRVTAETLRLVEKNTRTANEAVASVNLRWKTATAQSTEYGRKIAQSTENLSRASQRAVDVEIAGVERLSKVRQAAFDARERYAITEERIGDTLAEAEERAQAKIRRAITQRLALRKAADAEDRRYELIRTAAYAEDEKLRKAADAEGRRSDLIRTAAYAEDEKLRKAADAEDRRYELIRTAAYAEDEKLRKAADAEGRRSDLIRTAAYAEDEKRRTAALREETSRRKKIMESIGTISRAGLAVSAAGLAVVGSTAHPAVEWQRKVQQIQTMTDVPLGQAQAQGAQLQKIGERVGIMPEEMVDRFIMIRTLGRTAAAALKEIDVTASAARGTWGKFADVVNAVDVAMRAYGIDAKDTAQTTDVLVKGVRLGNMTWGEMSEAMAKAAPLAHIMHLSVEDIVASFISFREHGTNATDVGNLMQQMLIRLYKPTKEAKDAAHVMGLEWLSTGNAVSHIAKVGYPAAMAEIQKATGGSFERLAQLFGGGGISHSGGMRAMLALFSDQLKAFGKAERETNDSVGESSKASREAMRDLTAQLEAFHTAVHNAQIAIGTGLLPWMTELVKSATKAVKWFTDLSDTTKTLIGRSGAIGFGILGLASGLGLLIVQAAKVKKAFDELRAMFVTTKVAAEGLTAAETAAETAAVGAVSIPALIAGGVALAAGAVGFGIAHHVEAKANEEIALDEQPTQMSTIQALRRGAASSRATPFYHTAPMGDPSAHLTDLQAGLAGQFSRRLFHTDDLSKLTAAQWDQIAGVLSAQWHRQRAERLNPANPWRMGHAPGPLPPGTTPIPPAGHHPLFGASTGTQAGAINLAHASNVAALRALALRQGEGRGILGMAMTAANADTDVERRVGEQTRISIARVRLWEHGQVARLKIVGGATAEAIDGIRKTADAEIASIEQRHDRLWAREHVRRVKRAEALAQRARVVQSHTYSAHMASEQAALKVTAKRTITDEDVADPTDYKRMLEERYSHEYNIAQDRYAAAMARTPPAQRAMLRDSLASRRASEIEAAQTEKENRLEKLKERQDKWEAEQQKLTERMQASLEREINAGITRNERALRYMPGMTGAQRARAHAGYIRSAATFGGGVGLQSMVQGPTEDAMTGWRSQADELDAQATEEERKRKLARATADAKALEQRFPGEKDRSKGKLAVAAALAGILGNPALYDLSQQEQEDLSDEIARYQAEAGVDAADYEKNRQNYVAQRTDEDQIAAMQALPKGSRAGRLFGGSYVLPENRVKAAQLQKQLDEKNVADKAYGYTDTSYAASMQKQINTLLKPRTLWDDMLKDARDKFGKIVDSFSEAVGKMAAEGGNLKSWWKSLWSEIVSWFTSYVVKSVIQGIGSMFGARGAATGGGGAGGLFGAIGSIFGGRGHKASGNTTPTVGGVGAAASPLGANADPVAAAWQTQMSGVLGSIGQGGWTPPFVAGSGGLAGAAGEAGGVLGLFAKGGLFGHLFGGLGGLGAIMPWLAAIPVLTPLFKGLFGHHRFLGIKFDDPVNDAGAMRSGRDFTSLYLQGVSSMMADATTRTMSPGMPAAMMSFAQTAAAQRAQHGYSPTQTAPLTHQTNVTINSPTLLHRGMVDTLTDHIERNLSERLTLRGIRGTQGGRDRR